MGQLETNTNTAASGLMLCLWKLWFCCTCASDKQPKHRHEVGFTLTLPEICIFYIAWKIPKQTAFMQTDDGQLDFHCLRRWPHLPISTHTDSGRRRCQMPTIVLSDPALPVQRDPDAQIHERSSHLWLEFCSRALNQNWEFNHQTSRRWLIGFTCRKKRFSVCKS